MVQADNISIIYSSLSINQKEIQLNPERNSFLKYLMYKMEVIPSLGAHITLGDVLRVEIS